MVHPHTPTSCEILGIGTPIIDYIIKIKSQFLTQIPGTKGGSTPVTHENLIALIHKSHEIPSKVIGGSTTNTIKGLASLDRSCALFGKLGDDDAKTFFLNEIKKLHIKSYFTTGHLSTAQVACFITPDYERTMCSYLGAGTEVKPEDLPSEIFQGKKIVHIEGYLLTNTQFAIRAMQLAKQAGAKISFDVSSVEIVNKYSDMLPDLISTYIDILFANEEEAFALTSKEPEKACEEIKKMCEVAVVKMGKNGNWAASTKEKIFQPALPVEAVDTTGAGDLFASGFLHGYLSQLDLQQCSRYGALVAAEVVQVLGADIPEVTWKKIKKSL